MLCFKVGYYELACKHSYLIKIWLSLSSCLNGVVIEIECFGTLGAILECCVNSELSGAALGGTTSYIESGFF